MQRHIKWVRAAVAGLSLLACLALAAGTAGRWPLPFQSKLLMELDPLAAVTTALATGLVYAGTWLGLALLAATAIFGRFFCSWICPLGVLQDLAELRPGDPRLGARFHAKRYRRAQTAKYVILAALLILAVLGPVQAGLLDPLALFLRSVNAVVLPPLQALGLPLGEARRMSAGAFFLGLLFLALLVATRFLPRAWCRTACPLGALLGVAARWAPFQIRRNPDRCTDCRLCTAVCTGGADPHGPFRPSECVLCFNCIRACPEGALSYGPAAWTASHAPSPDLGRRQAIGATLAGLAAFPLLRSGTSGPHRPDPFLIRPPGSVDERSFLSRCLKCGVCMEACPTGGLQPAWRRGGFEALWTPVLVARIGYCEARCTACGEACPTGAILPLTVEDRTGARNRPPVKIGTAFIDRGSCLAWDMDTPCLVCEEVCPVSPKAIVAVERRTRDGRKLLAPQVVPDRCIGCGICEHHCPVSGQAAIRVRSTGESRSSKNRFLLGEGHKP